jgi:uncharacterized protein YjbI with pentapeptide repeats
VKPAELATSDAIQELWPANLRRADFTGADLTEADFDSAHVEGIRLRQANLARSNFSGCRLEKEVSDLIRTGGGTV